MIAFSFIFLALRFWTRWRTFGRFFSDDLFALIAWLSAAAMGAVAVYMVESMCVYSPPRETRRSPVP
jgi:uncharacterized membrane protein